MRVALMVIQLVQSFNENLATILLKTKEAAAMGADLVVFPEASLTGLINNDNPGHDLKLGIEIPSETTLVLCQQAKESSVYLALGLLEREGQVLYNSAILISPDGEIILKHRRISRGWHGPNADESVYGHGEAVECIDTVLGKIGFLICGDLFDVDLDEVARLNLDYLLYPYVRCSGESGYVQERWEREEEHEYVRRVVRTKATSFMVSYIAFADICGDLCSECQGGAYGGAMVVSPNGKIIAKKPLWEEGMLLVDV